MPFIKRSDIPEKIRKPHEAKLKGTLRAALQQPGLTGEQRIAIKDQLGRIGKPKEYLPNPIPKPGAVPVVHPRRRLPSTEELMALSKVDLAKRALQLGLPKSGNKPDLVARIRNALKGQGETT